MAIVLPVPKQEISAETFGIPVATELNRLTPLVDGSGRGMVGYAQMVANQAPFTVVADVVGLSVTFVADPTRRYLTTVKLELGGTVPGDLAICHITDGANGGKQRFICVAPALSSGTWYVVANLSCMESGLSGSQTRKARLERNSGTGTLAAQGGTTYPGFIMVQDIGKV